MGATEQLLPTISALVALGEFSQDGHLTEASQTDDSTIGTVSDGLSSELKQQRAEREWQGALAALSQLLNQHANTFQAKTKAKKKKSTTRKSTRHKSPQALVFSGPVPVLNVKDNPAGRRVKK